MRNEDAEDAREWAKNAYEHRIGEKTVTARMINKNDLQIVVP
jgi:hypothetical protein